ncbi:hypothetical protein CRYUN_Cryun17cG0123500 [Craigia yunnanensis]
MVSWSLLINGYRSHGHARGALELFSRIQLSGVSPDTITYSSILSACSHAGLVEEGQSVFNSMVEDGVSPRTEHYAYQLESGKMPIQLGLSWKEDYSEKSLVLV